MTVIVTTVGSKKGKQRNHYAVGRDSDSIERFCLKPSFPSRALAQVSMRRLKAQSRLGCAVVHEAANKANCISQLAGDRVWYTSLVKVLIDKTAQQAKDIHAAALTRELHPEHAYEASYEAAGVQCRTMFAAIVDQTLVDHSVECS